MYPHLVIYFGSPFGRYSAFHTLTSIGRRKKKFFNKSKNVAAVWCCSIYKYNTISIAVDSSSYPLLGTSSTEGSKRRVKPWQRGLIPLHLFAETVEIPEIKTDGKPLIIKAHLPEFFLETLKCCDLKPKRYGKTKYVKHFARR